jgi:uncharacterized membrane protein
MDNTQDFWFVTVPLTVITFLILKGAYWCIRKRKISKVLKPFCSVGNLAMSLIGDNIVYLSFRSFQQILYSEPQLNLKFWISHLLCLLTLFWVLFCAGAMPTVLLRYRRREFDNDFFHKSVQSTFLYSYILISRVLIGAIHSIISTPLWQITCLLLLHSLTLTLYSKNTQLFK